MKKNVPPRFALRFLEWFCPPELYEGIEGDLTEQYEEDKNELGEKRAGIRFIWSVLKFFRPGIFLRNKISMQFNTSMVASYVKIAIRNISKRKFYSFINAFGLSIGIAFCILVYLFIQDEKSFDQFHENKDLIYRLHTTRFSKDLFGKGDKNPYIHYSFLPAKLGDVMLEELPEVQHMTRFIRRPGTVRYQDKVFQEKDIVYVDSGFFKMFSFPFLSGAKKELFKNPSDAVLTNDFARKYFGDEDPIGKTFTLPGNTEEESFTVAGVIQSPPANSSLQFAVLLPIDRMPYFESSRQRWNVQTSPTFIQVFPGTQQSSVKYNLDNLAFKYIGELNKRTRELSNIPEQYNPSEFNIINLTDIHLAKEVAWDRVSDEKYTWILGGIAILVMLVACINYISLALTTSPSRKIEIGIRKVIGAQRKQILYQFGFESILLALLSTFLGIGFAFLFIPAFNSFTAKSIEVTWPTGVSIVGFGFLMAIIIGVLAGSYPAFFMSKYLPVKVLRGGFTSRLQAAFTKPLVVFQLIISMSLIISSVVMFRQMKFIALKDLGFDKERVIRLEIGRGWNNESSNEFERFKVHLKNNAMVLSVAGVSSSFNKGGYQFGYRYGEKDTYAYMYLVNNDYIPLLNIKVKEGRNFDENIISDSKAVIVNEALVKELGWENPLDQHLNLLQDSLGPGYNVIGVVEDYHFLSLEQKIEPVILSMDQENFGYLGNMLIKISAGDIAEKIEDLEHAWTKFFPDRPFVYSFVEDDIAQQYKVYERWMSITGFSTAFAIFIACLGLFGLSGVNAVNRVKEIGIRKVMGARLSNIFILLNQQFGVLAILAFACSVPVSWFAMDAWLSSFHYKITIGWELFAVGIVIGLTLMLLTISYHGIKAALINPADTLRHE